MELELQVSFKSHANPLSKKKNTHTQRIKGIIHTKMEILSSYYANQLFGYSFFKISSFVFKK